MKSIFRILACLLACGAYLPAIAAVTASLNRNHVAPGETVQLLLERDTRTSSQPDLAPLKRDFDILGSSSGSQIQIVNGQMSAHTQVDLTLAPKHDGKIQIPPLQWDGEQSPALEVTIDTGGAAAQPGSAAPAEAEHVFLTASLDQKQPYVQAAAVLTVRLYYDPTLKQASLNLPASSDVLVRQLGQDRQTSESRNGRDYQVVERKYLLFPQRSGQLSLDGPVLDAQVVDAGGDDPFSDDSVFRGVFGRSPFAGMLHATRPLHLRAKPIELNVLPRPAAAGAVWLPAQAVTLEESWRPDNLKIHVGEPITRHLHLAADGLTAAQLPDLSGLMPVPDGVKAYPDQAKLDDSPKNNTVQGSRDQDIALIASRPGQLVLPAMHLSWWDTAHNAQREAELPERRVDILPALAGATTPGVPSAPTAPIATPSLPTGIDAPSNAPSAIVNHQYGAQPWQWLSLALGMLWLGTLLAWWRERRRAPRAPARQPAAAATPSAIHAGKEFKSFLHACSVNDPYVARQSLLAWAGSAWPEQPPRGLNALARRLDDPKRAEALRQLDRACHMGEAWNGAALAHLFAAPPAKAAATAREQVLKELYP